MGNTMTQRAMPQGAEPLSNNVSNNGEVPGQVVHVYLGGGRVVFFNVVRPHYMLDGKPSGLPLAGKAD
ncbi:hypothetical protein EGT07_23165 [Herbaspirillum sp. HC18]|nr:hypothetical protein EGT07_23165 [Herbaspirillum sp. HC18]